MVLSCITWKLYFFLSSKSSSLLKKLHQLSFCQFQIHLEECSGKFLYCSQLWCSVFLGLICRLIPLLLHLGILDVCIYHDLILLRVGLGSLRLHDLSYYSGELFKLKKSVQTFNVSNLHPNLWILIFHKCSFDSINSIWVLICWPKKFEYYSLSVNQFSILETIGLHIIDDLW